LLVHICGQLLGLFDPKIEEQEFEVIQGEILFQHLHFEQIMLGQKFQVIMLNLQE
jgi:hypothetical protein